MCIILKHLKVMFVLAFVFLCLSSISHAAESQNQGRVLRISNDSEPVSIDPQLCNTVESYRIVRDLFEGLVCENAEGEICPAAATSWTLSPDGKVYTFTLRDNLKWSNGDPVVAEDFVYALRRGVDPKIASQQSYLLLPIINAQDIIKNARRPEELGVRAISANTLEIRVTNPTPYLIDILAGPIAMPVPKAVIEKFGKEWLKSGNIVSNGPYVMETWVPHERIVLKKSQSYWDRDNVNIEKVCFIPNEFHTTAVRQFVAGEVDIAFAVPINQFKAVAKQYSEALFTHPHLAIYFFGINIDHPTFKDNPKLRRALYYAIDRKVLCEKIVLGNGEPAYTFTPPFVKGYQPPKVQLADEPYEKQLKLARQLFADAGYSFEKPIELTISFNTGEDHKKIAIAVAAMWKKAFNANVTLRNEEWKVFISNLKSDVTSEIFRMGWVANYNSPHAFLDIFASDDSSNMVRYSDKIYDGLLKQAGDILDINERHRVLSLAEERLLYAQPIIPLFFMKSRDLVSKDIEGFKPNILNRHPTKYLRFKATT